MSQKLPIKNSFQNNTAPSSSEVSKANANITQAVQRINALPIPFSADTAIQISNELKKPFIQKFPQQSRGNGNLPDDVRMKMEKSFSTDFSDIKVYENSEEAKNLNAIAFTQGNEIHFSPSYNPYSSQGQEYLGHELQHVIQQKSGLVTATHHEQGFNVNFDNVLETEADKAGKKAAAGESVDAIHTSSSSLFQKSFIQKKTAPIQLLRTIPSSSFILDVNTTPDIVLQDLRHVASLAEGTYDNVNWRTIFYPAIEAQVRGKQLGSISHSWTSTKGIDLDWSVNISFGLENPVHTERPDEVRPIGSTQGGSSSPTLGDSQMVTSGQTAGIEGSITNAPHGKGYGGKASVGVNDSVAKGQLQGAAGGLTGGQSQTSQERVSRYIADLYVTISVSTSTSYSNSDWINPVAWGSYISDAVSDHNVTKTLRIGTITYDQPHY